VRVCVSKLLDSQSNITNKFLSDLNRSSGGNPTCGGDSGGPSVGSSTQLRVTGESEGDFRGKGLGRSSAESRGVASGVTQIRGVTSCNTQVRGTTRQPFISRKGSLRDGKSHYLAQINLHHSKAASASACRMLLGMGQTSICLIQEPYFYKGKIRGLNEAGRVYTSSSGDKPRACRVTSYDVKASVVPGFCTGDLVAVKTEWETGNVVYASV